MSRGGGSPLARCLLVFRDGTGACPEAGYPPRTGRPRMSRWNDGRTPQRGRLLVLARPRLARRRPRRGADARGDGHLRGQRHGRHCDHGRFRAEPGVRQGRDRWRRVRGRGGYFHDAGGPDEAAGADHHRRGRTDPVPHPHRIRRRCRHPGECALGRVPLDGTEGVAGRDGGGQLHPQQRRGRHRRPRRLSARLGARHRYGGHPDPGPPQLRDDGRLLGRLRGTTSTPPPPT